ncbi:hypothetical protein BKA63DRAFT_519642 [Paraphoma chrysanthemicola]|nr:hypothetical protein BKA63DRAFT_519642 [Paraphoma chrysanthemicola]
MFCDVDSDASASPSTISPPTSALSATSTNTTLGSSNTDPSTPRVTRRSNPVKRSHDGASSSPEMLTKKSRTQTLPEARSGAMVSPDVRSPWRCSIGGDNRTLLRNSSFTERAPAPPVVMNVEGTSTFPELSSFRPGAVGPQGVPVVSTPSRSNTRRQSAMERGGSPTPAETPIYARSLHLVDTEFSIFKKSHGDESTEFPLCLYCFRQHGAFNRIKEHGYEVCDGDEALDSHYWEAYGDGTG